MRCDVSPPLSLLLYHRPPRLTQTPPPAAQVIAEGIIKATKELEMTVPLIVRLQGTADKEAKAMIQESGMKIYPFGTSPPPLPPLPFLCRKAVLIPGPFALRYQTTLTRPPPRLSRWPLPTSKQKSPSLAFSSFSPSLTNPRTTLRISPTRPLGWEYSEKSLFPAGPQ